MDDLLQEFIAETRETLEALAGEIVAWETDPSDRARLDAIFRFVHTVKGSCGFLDLPRLGRLSHAAEDVLAAARAGTRAPDTRLVNAVLAIVDRIGEIVEAIDAGAALDDSSEDLLIAALAPEAAAASVAQAAPAATRAPSRSVRLSVDLLDRMMSGMSDMVLARNELARHLRGPDVDRALESAMDRLSATVAEMRDTVTRTRMQTIDALFSALPRLVRDTAAGVGKAVNLRIDGAEVELDREMIEMMRDPLVHMIRNAIDHGIEAPAARLAAGKREAGTLTVAARQSGNRIVIEIADDGAGIDTDRLVAKALAADPRRDAELRAMGPRERSALIFEAGLSSRDAAGAISGRGVGMDVVRANVEQIGGRIELDNRPGKGLTVVVHVPLTLSILSAVTVTVAGQRYAVPRQAIEEIVPTDGAARIDRIGDATTLTLRDRRLAMVDGAALMTGVARTGGAPMALVLDVPGGTFALGIDAVHDTEELVAKPAAPAVMAAGIYAGQTLPDSGLPMLLLDCAGIAATVGLRFDRAAPTSEETAIGDVPAVAALLFDDVDGMRRAVALAAIDRIEPLAAGALVRSGGRLRLTVDNHAMPVVTIDEAAALRAPSVLRFHDAEIEFAYPIAEAIDIVALPDDVAPVAAAGLIGGVAVIDGEAIELIDPLRLVEAARCGAAAPTAPICLLQGAETGWMHAMLRPSIEAAGYRVVTRLMPSETAAVVLAMTDDPVAVPGAGALLRLSRVRGDGLYRQDRAALLAALADMRGAA